MRNAKWGTRWGMGRVGVQRKEEETFGRKSGVVGKPRHNWVRCSFVPFAAKSLLRHTTRKRHKKDDTIAQ